MATGDDRTGLDVASLVEGVRNHLEFTLGCLPELASPHEYYQALALPNFFFHATTAYDILRHNGVPLAKLDFTGPF